MIDPTCKDVMKGLGITTFVETGLDMAETVAGVSRWFAEWDPDFGTVTDSITTGARPYNSWNEDISYPVFENVKQSRYQLHSVDVDQYSYNNAKKIFGANSNIQFHLQSSEQFLKSFVQEKIDSGSADGCFFFFDAHWKKYWPLLDETSAVARLKKFVVCIDDVFIPGKSDPGSPHGDYGFEVHRGTILDWAYIRPALEGVDAKVLYACEYNRDKRGWMLILVGYSDEELAGLDEGTFFELGPDDPAHVEQVELPPGAHLDFRNVIKQILPLNLLRAMVRIYQRLT
jgi:hypothetical protein